MSNTLTIPQVDWMMIAPICIVALAGIITLVMETLWPRRVSAAQWLVSILGTIAAGGAIVMQFGLEEGSTLNGLMVRDRFGLAVQLLILVASFLSILFSEEYLEHKRIPFGEFYPLVLWSTLGAMVMVTTHNLLVIFVGLEILSIALYVLAGMSRSEEKSEESAMKYFLLGAFASAFLLYGIAFIYGATGSLDLVSTDGARTLLVTKAWANSDASTHALLMFGGALVLVGLGFKSSLVPFHQWTPDVYQGAPTNVAAFMASVSKIAALGTLWRFLVDTTAMSDFYLPVLIWLAILTMTIGNLVALVQKDIKRILGYSSISHAGYVLVAIAANLKDPVHTNVSTVIYYLLAYTLMTVGSFAIIGLVAKGGKEHTRMEDLHGLSRRAPLAAASLIVFMISLIGMPPTAGFIGKWMIFNDALNAGLTPLAIVLAINSAISVYYYVGIIRAAYVVEDATGDQAVPKLGVSAATVLCLAGVVIATIFVTPFLGFVTR
jgi:NADH-quinone oxidoreductase subunit N